MENNLIFFTRFLVTEKGISICFNDEHSEKVESPISIIEKLNFIYRRKITKFDLC